MKSYEFDASCCLRLCYEASAHFKGGFYFYVRYDLFSDMQSMHDYSSQLCLSLIKEAVSQLSRELIGLMWALSVVFR